MTTEKKTLKFEIPILPETTEAFLKGVFESMDRQIRQTVSSAMILEWSRSGALDECMSQFGPKFVGGMFSDKHKAFVEEYITAWLDRNVSGLVEPLTEKIEKMYIERARNYASADFERMIEGCKKKMDAELVKLMRECIDDFRGQFEEMLKIKLEAAAERAAHNVVNP